MTRLIIFTVIVASSAVPAFAHSPFSTVFRKRFIQAPDDQLSTFYGSLENSQKFTSWARSTSKMDGCKICHGAKNTERNAFAQEIANRLRATLARLKGVARITKLLLPRSRRAWTKYLNFPVSATKTANLSLTRKRTPIASKQDCTRPQKSKSCERNKHSLPALDSRLWWPSDATIGLFAG